MRYILLLIIPLFIISCRAVFKTSFFDYCEQGLSKELKQKKLFILEKDKSNNILVDSNFAEYKQYENQKMEFYKTKRAEIESSSDHDYLLSSTYEPHKNCKNKQEYLAYLNKNEEIVKKTFDKKENDKAILEIRNYIKNLQARDREIKNQTNTQIITLTYEMSSIIRNEGLEDAKKALFVASDKSKFFSQYSFLLSKINDRGGKYYFAQIKDLDASFQYNIHYEQNTGYYSERFYQNHETVVQELGFTEVVVYATINGELKSKFIIKPKKGQTFNLDQKLDKYAFKITGKQEYKGETLAVVEAFM